MGRKKILTFFKKYNYRKINTREFTNGKIHIFEISILVKCFKVSKVPKKFCRYKFSS